MPPDKERSGPPKETGSEQFEAHQANQPAPGYRITPADRRRRCPVGIEDEFPVEELLANIERTAAKPAEAGGAEHLADMGMHVFPVDHPSLPECAGLHKTVPCNGDRGKHPSVAWGHAATTNPKMIAAWFSGRTCNVGVSCGPSNIVVLDEDEQGVLDTWAADNGVTLPDTYIVTTGRGRHFYYRWDHTVAPITNGAAQLFGNLKIDVRGQGGYAVGAGSVHYQGRVYEGNGHPIC
jgi:Bifunctional DNA primase/polymerase, N-terminal